MMRSRRCTFKPNNAALRAMIKREFREVPVPNSQASAGPEPS